MATVTAKSNRRQGKKDLREDKLVDLAYKAESFYNENKNAVLGVGGAIVAAILVIFVVRAMSESSRKAETYDISLGKMAYGGGNLPGAKANFESIISKYSGEVAAEAHYYLGRIALEEGDLTAADGHFSECISSSGDDHIVTAALSGQAASLENRKSYSDAAAKYLEIADRYPDNAFAPEALNQASRLYLKLNQIDDYKGALQKLVDGYPKSSNFAKAKRELDALP